MPRCRGDVGCLGRQPDGRGLAQFGEFTFEAHPALVDDAHAIGAAFDRPIRLRSIGVKPVELRRYGTRLEHDRAHGIDAAGIRARLTDL